MGYKGIDLRLYSNSIVKAIGLLALLAACEQPTTFVPGYTDKFTNYVEDEYQQADQLLQADYMFVLDYSYSMSGGNAPASTVLASLYDSMDDFTQELHNKNTDYNIGFVKGNSHANSASTISTDFVAPFITLQSTADGLNTQILAQISSVGQALNENTNYLLESALRVSKNQSSSFMRDGSQMVYVFFTDSDDVSNNNSRITGSKTTSYYVNELKKFRSNPAYISARSFTVMGTSACPKGQYDVVGTRIRTVAQGVDSLNKPGKCIRDNMADSLRDLARDVTKTTKRFLLRGQPAPGSVRVFVDNVEQLSQGADPVNGTWNQSGNEIVFVDGKEPPVSTPSSSTEVRFEYDMYFPLAQTPKPSTITVTVNGQSVPESAGNGWTYVSAGNRIEFHGSAVPPHQADVRVNYRLH